MNAAWQYLMLTRLSVYEWASASRLWNGVGLLRRWRSGSTLLRWGNEIALGLLMLVFALAPFVPNGLTGFLIIACGAFWMLLTVSEERMSAQKLSPVYLLLLLFWGIAIVATALSPVKVAAAQGLVKLTLYLFVFVLAERVVRSHRYRTLLVSVYLHTALIVSVEGWRQKLFGVEQLATWNDPSSAYANDTRVYSFLGNPNLLAAYLLPAIPLSICAFFLWKRWGPKLLAVVMLGVNAVCLYWTGSRGGWLGLAMALFVLALLLLYWVLPLLPRFWQVWAFPMVIGGLAAFVILAFGFVEPFRNRASTILPEGIRDGLRGVFPNLPQGEDSSNVYRQRVWESVREMIRDRPIIGIGPGNTAFNQIYPLYQQRGYTALSAYSIYLELLVEAGVFGLISFIWFLVVLLDRGRQQLQRLRDRNSSEAFWLLAALATVAGMLTHGAVDTVWYRPEIATLWWLMVAIIVSYKHPAPFPSASDLRRTFGGGEGLGLPESGEAG